MTEKQLYALLLGIISAGLTALGTPWTTVDVRQGNQPSITGTPSGPFVAVTNEPIRRFGSIARSDSWNSVDSVETHSETQQYVAMFQVDCQWKQNPSDPDFVNIPTAGDLAKSVSSILQSSATIAALVASGVGIDRISEVRQPPWKDDTDAFEYASFFDFCLTFPETLATEIPTMTPTKSGVYPI